MTIPKRRILSFVFTVLTICALNFKTLFVLCLQKHCIADQNSIILLRMLSNFVNYDFRQKLHFTQFKHHFIAQFNR